MPRDEVEPRPREAPGRGFEGWATGAPGGERPGVAGALEWGRRRLFSSAGLWLVGWATAALTVRLVSPTIAPGRPPVDVVGSLELLLSWVTFAALGDDALTTGLVGTLLHPAWALAQVVVVDVLLAAAALVFLQGSAPVPFGERLGWAGGAHAGRLFRLLVLGVVVVIVAWSLVPVTLFDEPIVGPLPDTPTLAGFSLGLVVLALLLDLARVRMVVVGDRSSLGSLVRAARMLARHPLRLPALYAVMAGLTALMTWGAAGPESPLVRFVGQELELGATVGLEIGRFLRVGVRLWTWAALIALYRGLQLERLAAVSLERSTTPV